MPHAACRMPHLNEEKRGEPSRLPQLTSGLLSSPLGIADASIALRSRLSQFIENQLYFGRRESTPA